MEEELRELRTVDAALTRARIDCKNLTTQMFSERFNLQSGSGTARITSGGARLSQ
jgi:hypothetical protein